MKNKIFITVLALAVVAGGAYYLSIERPVYPDRPVAEEDRVIFEQRLLDTQGLLAQEDIDENQRFNYTMQLGFNYYGLGEYKKAEEAYMSALEIEVDHKYTAYTALYQLYLDTQQNRAARAAIQQALSLRPESADLWNKYIVLEKDRFNATSAELDALYDEAINTTFFNVDVLTAYATFLEADGRIEMAIEYWERAIVYDESSKEIYQAEIDRLRNLNSQ